MFLVTFAICLSVRFVFRTHAGSLSGLENFSKSTNMRLRSLLSYFFHLHSLPFDLIAHRCFLRVYMSAYLRRCTLFDLGISPLDLRMSHALRAPTVGDCLTVRGGQGAAKCMLLGDKRLTAALLPADSCLAPHTHMHVHNVFEKEPERKAKIAGCRPRASVQMCGFRPPVLWARTAQRLRARVSAGGVCV